MKLKFRADSRDWAMFGGYCVVLLYFVAIAVLNIIQFAKGDLDQPLYGLNPFPAFGPGYIGITLTCYIAAVVASMFSVSDRFFEMDKGFGFSTEPKSSTKGFARWLTSGELKKQLSMVRVQDYKADAGGIPLINDGKKMWVDNGEGHNLIIGSTGAGKTQIAIFPLVQSLAKHDESMIITDPKGEIYETTAEMLKKRGYNVVLLNFRNPQEGSAWNPLHLPYKYYKEGNSDKASELTDDLAMNILYDQNAQNQDPFWEKTSADYFSGICQALFEDADESEINLNSVNLFTTVGEEKCGPNSTYVNEYFKTKDPTSPAYVSASSTLAAPSETKGSILSVFKQKIRLFAARENIAEMLSHSDFEFEEIGKNKTAVFIVIQDEKKTYHSLVTIFLKQCYETLVDYAQKCGGKLPYRTNFILDEFANMPPLKDVDTMVSAARSRKMRFYFVIQNFAQLSEVYGKERGDTIKGNCTNIIYLISTELAALKEISEMCGEIKVKTKDKDDKEKEENRPLITVSDLQRLKQGEIILLRLRTYPFKNKLKMNWQIDWGDKCEKATYPTRKKQEVKTFDLKGFVNAKRNEKMNQIAQQLMPGMRPNPSEQLTPDQMIKNIDAKIAELEAKERLKKAGIMDSDHGSGVPIAKIDPIKVPVSVPHDSMEIPKKPLDDFKFEPEKKVEVKPVEPEIVKVEPKPSDSELKHDIEIKHAVKPEVHIEPKAEIKHNVSSSDFAAKITSRVNKVAREDKENEKKTENKPEKYVTDDQFFDDFFADDDDK